MNQARWLVVFSVIICMIGTLTILSRISSSSKPMVQNEAVKEESPEIVVGPDKAETRKIGPARKKYGQIKFSKPPAHTFAVESAADFSRSEALNSDAGKIIE